MLSRPFNLLPVQAIAPSEGRSWEINHEFKNWELWAILLMEPRINDLHLPFSFAYALRWHELSWVDSDGCHFLISGKSIRTPLHIWCRQRGIYTYFSSRDITFPDEERAIF